MKTMKTMKTKFLMIVILLMSVVSFADNKVKVDSIQSETIDTAVYNDGKRVLENIATGASDMAATGYDIVVQQQRMYAFQYLIVGILSIISLFLFLRYYSKIPTSKNMIMPAIIFGIIAIWTAIVFSLNYSIIVQGLVNPDYAAVKDIVLMFKK